MMELIHMTAAYSNAMLVAILPQVSDFAKKLDLPIPQPITVSQVLEYRPSPYKGQIGGGLELSSHYFFAFMDGYVASFRAPDNAFYIRDSDDDWRKYAYGKDNMTTNQAIELARDTLRKLGYEPAQLHAESPPTSFEGPRDLKDGHHIPHCEMRWEGPIESDSAGRNVTCYLEFQINMEKKTVTGMAVFSGKLRRPPPKLDVEPELESEYLKKHSVKMFVRTNAPPHPPNPPPSKGAE